MLGKNNYLQKNPWGKLTQKPMFYTPVTIYFVQILICCILQMRGHPWRIYLEGALWLHHKLLHRPGLTKKSISMRSWNTVAWRELGKSYMSSFACLSFCYLLLYICSINQPMMSWLLLWLLDVTGGLGRSPDTSALHLVVINKSPKPKSSSTLTLFSITQCGQLLSCIILHLHAGKHSSAHGSATLQCLKFISEKN